MTQSRGPVAGLRCVMTGGVMVGSQGRGVRDRIAAVAGRTTAWAAGEPHRTREPRQRGLGSNNNNLIVLGPIIYYINKRVSFLNGKMKYICFFIITLPNYLIVLGLFYLKAYWVVLNLKIIVLRYHFLVTAKGPRIILIGSKNYFWN